MNISEQLAPAFEQQPNKVFIGGLSVNCEESELSEFLEKFGPLTKVEVIKDPKTRVHKGYAFATFTRKRDMQRALGKNHVLKGKQFEIREFVDSNTNSEYLDRIAKRKIFISNIKEPLTERDLTDFFSVFGEIEELIISRDASTGLSKGFGFVLFIEEESQRKVLRDFGVTGVRVKCYDLQVKEAIPKKDINKIKQAGVLSPLQEGQAADAGQNFLPRHFDFSEQNPYLPGMISVIQDPNPSPASFMKDGLTPTTYLHSDSSPFTPRPGKFSFTPVASPLAMVHPQFSFNQQLPHRLPDYRLSAQFPRHLQDLRLAPNSQAPLAWLQELRDPEQQLPGELANPQLGKAAKLQACSADQRGLYPTRNASPVQDCESSPTQRLKLKKPAHLVLKLGQSDKADKTEADLASLPLPRAVCLCSTDAGDSSDPTSLFTTLRRIRCSCGGQETQGAPTESKLPHPAQMSEGQSTLGQQPLRLDGTKRLEKVSLEHEPIEYNIWQDIKVSKLKLQKLRPRIASQEESQVSGLFGSPQGRDAKTRQAASHLDHTHH